MPVENLQYPYGVPGISGTEISLDWLVRQPARLTRVIANLAASGYYVDQVFRSSGPIVGGAVIYEQAHAEDLFPNRDIRKVEAGDEFPIVGFDRTIPLTAQVEKFGGKFPITDEAVRRNQLGRVTVAAQKLANVIVRKTQQRALSELQAAITANARTAIGRSWLDYAAAAPNTVAPANAPIADLVNVEQLNEVQEMGYVYSGAIMNPQEWGNLRLAAGGTAAGARALLADGGITTIWVTNRKAAGTVYWFAPGMVGELGYEVPLSTESWRDKDGKQQTWYQSFVLPICYVTDPFAILETTGHAA